MNEIQNQVPNQQNHQLVKSDSLQHHDSPKIFSKNVQEHDPALSLNHQCNTITPIEYPEEGIKLNNKQDQQQIDQQIDCNASNEKQQAMKKIGDCPITENNDQPNSSLSDKNFQIKEMANQQIIECPGSCSQDNQPDGFKNIIKMVNLKPHLIFYHPQQILPLQPVHPPEVDIIVPCTIGSHNKPMENPSEIRQPRNLNTEQSIIESGYKQKKQHYRQESIIYSQIGFPNKNLEVSRSKVMTGVLIDKITELEGKIKTLELQKQKLLMGDQLDGNSSHKNQYQSTPTIRKNHGGIRSQQPFKKQFQSTHETNQTNNANNFRVRNFGSVIRSSAPNNRLVSNVYNQTLIENSSENSAVRSQIKSLKEKIRILQQNYNSNDRTSQEMSTHKILQGSLQMKNKNNLFLPDSEENQRSSLKGKIVKRNIFQFSPYSPHADSSYTQSPTQQGKGFVRNQFIVSEVRQKVEEQYDDDHQRSHSRKRIDSSAIFKKKLDNSVVNNGRVSQFKTLEFNPQKQKFIIDSKQTEELFPSSELGSQKNQSRQPVSPIKHKESNEKFKKQQNQLLYFEDIPLPELPIAPKPSNNSEELIEIGKLAFIKLGYEINESTQLNVKKFKNCVYFGINNAPTQNILWHYEGKFYYGGWKLYTNGEGEKFGEGIEIVSNRYRFRGHFVDGKKSGYGTLVMENPDNAKISVYVGQWEQGVKHGNGKQIDNSGQYVYLGEFKSNKKNGYGKIYYNLNLQFEGVFVKGLKNGYGKEIFENGDVYDGNYVNNKFDGKGVYTWKTGAIYSGEFVEGKRQGKGIWKTDKDGDEGDTYEGDYFQDMKHGYGVYKWENGCMYEGSFMNDLKHGQGKMTYQNGKIAHLIYEKGKVMKKLDISSRPQAKSAQKRPGSNIAFKTRNHSSKKLPFARSSEKLHSAKSTSSLPKGINFKKDHQFQHKAENKPKGNHDQFLKLKLGQQNNGFRSKSFTRTGQPQKKATNGPPIDPPYRGMQTTSNINMNI